MKQQGIIPKDTRYVPLTQQPYCCVPTCFQMVMVKNNIPLVPAELMAHYMHIMVPKKNIRQFWNVRTGPRPTAGYGTQLSEQLTADPMFKKLKIPLKMSWRLIDTFGSVDELSDYLVESVKHDKDVILCFNAKALKSNWVDNGHVCVLDRVYPRKGIVRMVDPSPREPKWCEVNIKKLYKAMQAHGVQHNAGCWELCKI